jgi:DNA polymerase III subunit beta
VEVDILAWLDDLETTKPVRQEKSIPTQTLVSSVSTGTSFEIDRDVLLHLLEKVIGVVPTRDMVPVLTNFQFVVKDNELKVIGSSLEMSIVVSTTQIETKVPGVEVFPARTLLNIVKEAGSGSKLFFEVTSLGAVIVAGGFSIEVKLPNGSDFPVLSPVNDVEFYEISRQEFLNAISAVKYALPSRDFGGQDSLRMINVRNGKFTVFDGSRLQQVRIENFKFNMKLPASNINTLIKVLLGYDQETVEIGELPQQLVFRLNNCLFYMNKLETVYPNVEQLWLRPALANDQPLIIDKQQLITAIKQVKIAADSDSNAIALLLHGDIVEIRAKDTNNAAKVVIPGKWQGKPRNLVVNYIHLTEMLKAYAPDECKFMLGEDTKQRMAPVMLKDDETLAIATIPQMLAYRAGLI